MKVRFTHSPHNPRRIHGDLGKIRPDFDPRLFGLRRLSGLFKGNPKLFAVEERGAGKAVYVRVVR